MNLFTYGTLMFDTVWLRVTGRPFPSVEATLPGYRIFGVRDELFPGIVVDESATDGVKGRLYREIDPGTMARLDTFEDWFYVRELVPVLTAENEALHAHAYVVPPENVHVLTEAFWDPADFAASHLNRFLSGR